MWEEHIENYTIFSQITSLNAPKCAFVELLESIATSEFEENQKVNIISQYIND